MTIRSIGIGFLFVVVVATGGCHVLFDKTVTTGAGGRSMKIKIASIFVDDQDKALEFYTKTLGFMKKDDIPAGDFRWLTVVSPDAPEGMELLLEPNAHGAARAYQKTIFEEGIPATTFFVDDIRAEFDRLGRRGVRFTVEPTEIGSVIIAVFDDTCGNLIQLTER